MEKGADVEMRDQLTSALSELVRLRQSEKDLRIRLQDLDESSGPASDGANDGAVGGEALISQLAGIVSERDRLKRECERLQDELKSLKSQSAASDGRITNLSAKIHDYQTGLDRVKAALERKSEEQASYVQRLQITDAVAAALKDELNTLILHSKFSNENRLLLNRLTSIVTRLDDCRSPDLSDKRLLSRLGAVNEILKDLVSLDQQFVAHQNVVAAMQVEAEHREEQLKHALAAVEAKDAQNAKLGRTIRDRDAEVERITAQIGVKQAEIDAVTATCSGLSSQLLHEQNKLCSALQQLEAGKPGETTDDTGDAHQQTINELEERLAKEQQLVAKYRKEIADLTETRGAALSSLREQLADMENQRDVALNTLDQTSETKDRLALEVHTANEAVKAQAMRIRQNERVIADLQDEIRIKAQALLDAKRELDRYTIAMKTHGGTAVDSEQHSEAQQSTGRPPSSRQQSDEFEQRKPSHASEQSEKSEKFGKYEASEQSEGAEDAAKTEEADEGSEEAGKSGEESGAAGDELAAAEKSATTSLSEGDEHRSEDEHYEQRKKSRRPEKELADDDDDADASASASVNSVSNSVVDESNVPTKTTMDDHLGDSGRAKKSGRQVAVEGQLIEAEAKLAKMELELVAAADCAAAEVAGLKASIADLTQRLEEAEGGSESVHSVRAVLEEDILAIQESLREAKAALETKVAEVESLRAEVESLRAEIESKEKEWKTRENLELLAKDSEIQSLRDANASVVRQLEDLSKEQSAVRLWSNIDPELVAMVTESRMLSASMAKVDLTKKCNAFEMIAMLHTTALYLGKMAEGMKHSIVVVKQDLKASEAKREKLLIEHEEHKEELHKQVDDANRHASDVTGTIDALTQKTNEAVSRALAVEVAAKVVEKEAAETKQDMASLRALREKQDKHIALLEKQNERMRHTINQLDMEVSSCHEIQRKANEEANSWSASSYFLASAALLSGFYAGAQISRLAI